MAGYWQPAMHVTKAAVRKGLESTFAETLKTKVGLGRKTLYNPFSQTMIVKGGDAATKVAQVRKAGEENIHITTERASYDLCFSLSFNNPMFNRVTYMFTALLTSHHARMIVAKAGCVKKTQRCTIILDNHFHAQ